MSPRAVAVEDPAAAGAEEDDVEPAVRAGADERRARGAVGRDALEEELAVRPASDACAGADARACVAMRLAFADQRTTPDGAVDRQRLDAHPLWLAQVVLRGGHVA